MNLMNCNVSNFENTAGVKLRSSISYNNRHLNSKDKTLDALKWLVKNMYLVSSSTSSTEKTYMKNYIESLISKYCASSLKSCKLNNLNDEQIGVIQQFVVWKFLEPKNNKGYYQNGISGINDVKKITGIDTNDKANSGYALFNALCTAAMDYANNKTSDSMPSTSNNKFNIVSSKSNREIKPVQGETNTYKVGPMKFEANNLEKLNIFLTSNIENNKITSWKIINSSNNDVILKSEDIKTNPDVKNKIVGKSFYIKFTTNEEMTQNPRLSLSYTYWYKAGLKSYAGYVYYKENRQPILEINKQIEKYGGHEGITFSYNPPEYDLDLALTKEIAQIYRYDDNSKKYSEVYNSTNKSCERLINIENQYIASTGTARYNMNKTPVRVKPGDIIRYKMTVYNEGNIEGVVKQISDYLPTGLEFLKIDKSTEYGKYNYQYKNNITYNEKDNLIKFNISKGKTVSEGNSFSIYIECKVSDDVKSGDILKNVAAITDYGYKNNFGIYRDCSKDGVDSDSVQNNVNNNIDYIKKIDEKLNNKDLSKINKGILVEEDDEDFEQVEVGGFDLALRKFITTVYNNNFSADYNREPKIHGSTLTNFRRGATTAKYSHTKSPVNVSEGDTVVYTIRVYNEGYIDGYAKQINDYLPEELVLKEESDINNKYGWKKAQDGSNCVYTEYLKDTKVKAANGVTGFEKLYDNELGTNEEFWTDIQIECVVTGVMSKNGRILTNMAEISNYGYDEVILTSDGNVTTKYKQCTKNGIDIDSVQNTLLKNLQSEVQGSSTSAYYAYQTSKKKHNIYSDTQYEGLEDDDDFENVKVNLDSFDLALRKYITKVNGQNLNEKREPEIKKDSISYLTSEGTARYYHTKYPVSVNTGDKVTYTIRVYNEGYKEGIVKEITDYLPAGLEFVPTEESSVNKNNGWVATKNANGTTTIKTNKEFDVKPSKARIGYSKLFKGTLSDEDVFWKDVEVECKVTSIIDGKILTNVAEISNYGYMQDGAYVQANEKGIVDIDSQNNNVFGESGINTVQYYREKVVREGKTLYSGREDDDDFENIKVNSKYSYNITLEKTDESGQQINGSIFSVIKLETGKINQIEELYSKLGDAKTETIVDSESIDGSMTKKVENLVALKNYFYKVDEISSADGYSNLLDGYSVLIPTYIASDGKVKLGCYDINADTEFIIIKEDENGNISAVDKTDDLYSKVKVTLNNDLEIPEIKISVENKKIDGYYKFRVNKVDEQNVGIGNIRFKIKRKDNNTGKEVQMNLTTSQDPKYLGIRTSNSIAITDEGTDEFTITEINLNNKPYIKLADQNLKLFVKKEIVDNKYKATKVSFKENEEGSQEEILEGVKLEDGTTVTIKAAISGNLVTLTIPNKKITGSYNLQIEKTGETEDVKLKGVTFKVTDSNFNLIGDNYKTGDNGIVKIIDNQTITEEGVDCYYITEADVGDNEYIKLKDRLKIYIEKKIQDYKYKVTKVSFEPINDETECVQEKEISLADGKNSVLAHIKVEDGTVKITIANKKVKGQYQFKIKKVDNEDVPISGVNFKVKVGSEEKVPLATNEFGRTWITTKNITQDNVNDIDEYTITEINLNNRPYVKLKNPITVYVHKAKVGYVYKATSISFTKEKDGSKNETLESVELENGNKVNVSAGIFGEVVMVTIPNEKLTGSYDLKIIKTKEDKTTAIEGIKFRVTKGEGKSAQEIPLNNATDARGELTVVKDEKITAENVEQKDIYTIKEVMLGNKDYISLKDEEEISVYVTKGIKDNKYVATDVSFDKENKAKTKEVELQDGSKVVVEAKVENGVVVVTIPNKEIQGEYGLQIIKTAEDDKPLPGVKFKVTKEEGQSAKELNVDKVTDETGKVTIFENEKITSSNVDTKDVYTIEEIELPEKAYIRLKDSLNIYVTKGRVEDKYQATNVSFEKDKNESTKKVLLQDDKTEVTVSAIIKNGLVIVTIPNHIIEGKYDFELIKVDQKDGKTPLEGVTFDVITKKGDDVITLYNTSGEEIKTKDLTTDSEGKIIFSDIKITEGASYNFEIKEVKVPDGYTMLKDPIKVSFETKIDEFKYIVANTKVSGVAELEQSENKITVKVQNGQFDLALRKFITGVTTSVGTENQTKNEVTNRIPVFKIDEAGNYIYEHTKEPVTVGNQNIVEYTLRVYNEGSIAGYASKIKDDIPDGLEFLPNDETNIKYGWILLDEKGNITQEVNKAKYITTDYLSKEKEENEGENLLKSFNTADYETGDVKEPDYKEVKVAFKVTMPNTDEKIIINKAQISKHSDKDGNDITDKDSVPDVWNEGEDDQDIEKVKVLYFDLALRKWVTKAIVIENGTQTATETGHTAEDDPEEIVKVDLKKSKLKNIVVKFEYKIRITNEGKIAGYAKEISDYIPEGLRFDQAENPLWQEVEGKVTTDQLKDTLLNPGETTEVSIILTWINREDNMGLKVNTAEISKDYNEYGTPDIDSTPNNQKPGEDDIDDAPVMLTVKTGQAATNAGVIAVVLTILAGGVIAIKKFVLK